MKYPEDFINKVIQGDCLEVMKQMPDKCVDLVLTDPPYGIGMNKHFGSGVENIPTIDGDWDNNIPSKEYFDEIFRVSKNQVFFGGNYFTKYLPPTSCWIVWDKNNGASTFGDGELIWTSFKGALRIHKHHWVGLVSGREDTGMKVHPTQKPKELITWIIARFSQKETDLILDPFLGSGTTAVAAKQLKRNFIGIEISEKYCEIARGRLRQEILI